MLKHAHGLLYAQHDTARKEWQLEKQRLTEQAEKAISENERSRVQLQELEVSPISLFDFCDNSFCATYCYFFFQRLQDTLTKDESEQKRRLGEMSRKFTVARINESIMVRKYRTLELEAKTFYFVCSVISFNRSS